VPIAAGRSLLQPRMCDGATCLRPLTQTSCPYPSPKKMIRFSSPVFFASSHSPSFLHHAPPFDFSLLRLFSCFGRACVSSPDLSLLPCKHPSFSFSGLSFVAQAHSRTHTLSPHVPCHSSLSSQNVIPAHYVYFQINMLFAQTSDHHTLKSARWNARHDEILIAHIRCCHDPGAHPLHVTMSNLKWMVSNAEGNMGFTQFLALKLGQFLSGVEKLGHQLTQFIRNSEITCKWGSFSNFQLSLRMTSSPPKMQSIYQKIFSEI